MGPGVRGPSCVCGTPGSEPWDVGLLPAMATTATSAGGLVTCRVGAPRSIEADLLVASPCASELVLQTRAIDSAREWGGSRWTSRRLRCFSSKPYKVLQWKHIILNVGCFSVALGVVKELSPIPL